MLLYLGLRLLQATGTIANNDYMEYHFRMDALMIGVYCSYLFYKDYKLINYFNRNKVMAIGIVCISRLSSYYIDRNSFCEITRSVDAIDI